MSSLVSGVFSYVTSMFTWSSTNAEENQRRQFAKEDKMEEREMPREGVDFIPLNVETLKQLSDATPLKADPHLEVVDTTTHSVVDPVHVKDEVVSYPAITGEDQSRLETLMKEGKSLYPALLERTVEAFKFNGPQSEAKPKVASDSDGSVLLDETSPFKKPFLPETGISIPQASNVSTSGTSRAELEQRVTTGKMIRWSGLFKQSLNGLPLVRRREFSKAMEAFPFSHSLNIVHRADQDAQRHQHNLVSFNQAHQNYLEALEKPVRVLQSEVNGLSLADQIKYFDAASQEVTQVNWVNGNASRQRKVERDFKSTALVNLIDSAADQILRSPRELLRVSSMVNDHLLPFARIQTEREDSLEGVYAHPIKHKVNEEREITTMDYTLFRDLVEYEARKKSMAPISPLEQQQWGMGQVIYNELMARVIPKLDESAPKTPEEITLKMKENLANTAQLLNEALGGKPINESWKRQIRELSDSYDFLNWQMIRYFPSAPEEDMSGFTLQSHLQHGIFKYSLIKTSEQRSLPSERNTFIEYVKEFLPVQRVVRGIAEAMEGKFDGFFRLQEALAFNPLTEDAPIALTVKDLM